MYNNGIGSLSINNICDRPTPLTLVIFLKGGNHALIFYVFDGFFHHYILHCYLQRTLWSLLIVKIFLRKKGINNSKINLSQ